MTIRNRPAPGPTSAPRPAPRPSGRPQGTGTTGTGGAAPSGWSAPPSRRPVLREGSRGPEVRTLQQDLNRAGARLQEDGVFGPRTRAAVVDFQQRSGLATDGVVGPRTHRALDRAQPRAQTTTPQQPRTPQQPQTTPQPPQTTTPQQPQTTTPQQPQTTTPQPPGRNEDSFGGYDQGWRERNPLDVQASRLSGRQGSRVPNGSNVLGASGSVSYQRTGNDSRTTVAGSVTLGGQTNTTTAVDARYGGRGQVRSTETSVTTSTPTGTTTHTDRSSTQRLPSGAQGQRTSSRDTSSDRRGLGEDAWNNREATAGVGVEYKTDGRVAGFNLGSATPSRDIRTTGAGLEVSALRYEGRAGAAASVNLRNGQVNVGGSASLQADLVNVHGRAQLGNSHSVVGAAVVQGEARVGGTAAAGAGVQVDPRQGRASVRAGAEAFAGAEATGRAGYENRYGGIAVEGRAQAGIGGAAAVEAGYDRGRVSFRADLGAVVGVGGRLRMDINVNVGAIARDGWDGAVSGWNSARRFLGF